MNPHFHSSVTQVHDVFVRIFNSGKNWIITKSAMDMVYEILSTMITMLDIKTTIGINTIRMIEIRNIILHRLSYPSRMILRREIITRTTMILIVYSSLEFFFLPPPSHLFNKSACQCHGEKNDFAQLLCWKEKENIVEKIMSTKCDLRVSICLTSLRQMSK